MNDKKIEDLYFMTYRSTLIPDEKYKTNHKIRSSYDAIRLASDLLEDHDKEVIFIVGLDQNNEVISASFLSTGSLLNVQSYNRDIFKFLFLSNSSKFILIHNHPIGTIKPSQNDIKSVYDLLNLSKKLDINFYDAIIVGNRFWKKAYYSFAQKKIIYDKEASHKWSERSIYNDIAKDLLMSQKENHESIKSEEKEI